MEKFDINPETLNLIRINLEYILGVLDEDELPYDRDTIYDILLYGSSGLTVNLGLEIEDLPTDIEIECDEIATEVELLFGEDDEIKNDFIEALLDDYSI